MITDHGATGIVLKSNLAMSCNDFTRRHMVHMPSHKNRRITCARLAFYSAKAVAA
jgi:hypothetical protein